ncbi:hypothetical protein LEN26_002290 [Aphanomyces euteiches]|nr:hypothetical protein AeMF1_005238 [Aphanomyces euteiches]KAH9159542.1 hypothetical protein LEN26_002290 [Aphanomyces euteiches]
MILRHVQHKHASKNTIMHALFIYYFLGAKCVVIARLFRKSMSTISSWIERYENTSDYNRKVATVVGSFSDEHKHWVVSYYKANPVAYLDEAKRAFETHFKKYISVTTVWRIIHSFGLTWKVLERRAIQGRQDDVFRFSTNLPRSTGRTKTSSFLTK